MWTCLWCFLVGWSPAFGQSGLGRPAVVALAPVQDHFLLGTAKRKLAAISFADGRVLWSRDDVLDVHGRGWGFLRTVGDTVVVADKRGHVLALNVADGEIQWEQNTSAPVLDVFRVSAPEPSVNVMVGERSLRALDATGAVMWALPASEGDRFRGAGQREDGTAVCALLSSRGKTSVLNLAPASGDVTGVLELPPAVAAAVDRGDYLVAGPWLAILGDKEMLLFPLCGDAAGEWSTPDVYDMKAVQTRPPKPNWFHPWSGTPDAFVVTNGAFTFVFRAGSPPGKETGLGISWINNAVGAVGPVQASQVGVAALPGAIAMAVPREKEHAYETRVAGHGVPKGQQPSMIQGLTANGEPKLAIAQELALGQYRFVVACADGSLVGVDGDRLLWTRDKKMGLREEL